MLLSSFTILGTLTGLIYGKLLYILNIIFFVGILIWKVFVLSWLGWWYWRNAQFLQEVTQWFRISREQKWNADRNEIWACCKDIVREFLSFIIVRGKNISFDISLFSIKVLGNNYVLLLSICYSLQCC